MSGRGHPVNSRLAALAEQLTTDLTEDEKIAVVRYRLEREKAELHRRINEIDELLKVQR